MVKSKGIWVISNGFIVSKGLANHVGKLKTLTSCLWELFLQCELSALDRQAKRDKDDFVSLPVHANVLLVNLTGKVKAEFATGLQTNSINKTLI